jgi:hypothetical protein
VTAYLLGNLLGRLVVSYLLVWIACLLFSRLNWREAFRHTHKWYGIVGVAVLFSLGLLTAMSKLSA